MLKYFFRKNSLRAIMFGTLRMIEQDLRAMMTAAVINRVLLRLDYCDEIICHWVSGHGTTEHLDIIRELINQLQAHWQYWYCCRSSKKSCKR